MCPQGLQGRVARKGNQAWTAKTGLQGRMVSAVPLARPASRAHKVLPALRVQMACLATEGRGASMDPRDQPGLLALKGRPVLLEWKAHKVKKVTRATSGRRELLAPPDRRVMPGQQVLPGPREQMALLDCMA